jgi:uncharacterized protein (DUF488 family)
MITIYTIGFTRKSAEQFFNLLEKNDVKTVFDVRLNNSTQLAGFSKGKDLEYFLRKILSVNYIHDTNFSPTKEILDNYKKKKIDWKKYEEEFNKLLMIRNLDDYIKVDLKEKLNNICFLCSEDTAEYCHRRLVAEYVRGILKDEEIEIIHI